MSSSLYKAKAYIYTMLPFIIYILYSVRFPLRKKSRSPSKKYLFADHGGDIDISARRLKNSR